METASGNVRENVGFSYTHSWQGMKFKMLWALVLIMCGLSSGSLPSSPFSRPPMCIYTQEEIATLDEALKEASMVASLGNVTGGGGRNTRSVPSSISFCKQLLLNVQNEAEAIAKNMKSLQQTGIQDHSAYEELQRTHEAEIAKLTKAIADLNLHAEQREHSNLNEFNAKIQKFQQKINELYKKIEQARRDKEEATILLIISEIQRGSAETAKKKFDELGTKAELLPRIVRDSLGNDMRMIISILKFAKLVTDISHDIIVVKTLYNTINANQAANPFLLRFLPRIAEIRAYSKFPIVSAESRQDLDKVEASLRNSIPQSIQDLSKRIQTGHWDEVIRAAYDHESFDPYMDDIVKQAFNNDLKLFDRMMRFQKDLPYRSQDFKFYDAFLRTLSINHKYDKQWLELAYTIVQSCTSESNYLCPSMKGRMGSNIVNMMEGKPCTIRHVETDEYLNAKDTSFAYNSHLFRKLFTSPEGPIGKWTFGSGDSGKTFYIEGCCRNFLMFDSGGDERRDVVTSTNRDCSQTRWELVPSGWAYYIRSNGKLRYLYAATKNPIEFLLSLNRDVYTWADEEAVYAYWKLWDIRC